MNAMTAVRAPRIPDGPDLGHTSIQPRFSTVDEVLPGLDAAIQSLIPAANLEHNCGIRVTRHGAGDYTVALDQSVRFGETVTRIAG